MNIIVENNAITNPTLTCLMEWVQLITELIHEEDDLFPDMETLARQLEYYRLKHMPDDPTDREKVTVKVYGGIEILVMDQTRGEYIRLKKGRSYEPR